MIDTDKYEGHMNGYYFEGSNFDLEHLTMYDFHGNEIAVLKLNVKSLIGGIPFVSPTIEIMADAPLLLAEVKRLREENKVLAKYRDIVNKYDDALLADGDEDPRWSELYD
tara:strand:- start:2135 stop:2464 length:330 start_codon:yes stop_codon:yes gene_type:complete